MSVDAYSAKYPSLTPYNFAGNNSVIYVDPDGNQIELRGNDGSVFIYEVGKSYEGSDTFIKKAVVALDDIANGDSKLGLELVNELVTSSNKYEIKENTSGSADSFTPESSKIVNAYKSQLYDDPAQSAYKKIIEDNNKDIGGGAGGNILWTPSGYSQITEGGFVNSPVANLIHELCHASDSNNGRMDSRDHNGLSRNEWQASYRENLIRKEKGLGYRLSYGGEVDQYGTWNRKTGIKMLDKKGLPIKPAWLK